MLPDDFDAKEFIYGFIALGSLWAMLMAWGSLAILMQGV